MKKMTKKSTPILLLAAAAVLLLASTVGSTQAALTYYSDNYSAEVNVSNIGITLLENGSEISHRDYLKDDNWDEVQGTLFANMLAEGEELVLGKSYPAALTVTNSGAIDTYVRVILTKSWKDAQGVKNTSLSPDLIGLGLVTGDNGWVIDEASSTPERTILYYTEILPVGETTPAMTDLLRIDPAMDSCVVKIHELTWNGTPVPVKGRKMMVTNGRVANDKSVIFATQDPNINLRVGELPGQEQNKLKVRMEVRRIPKDMAEDLAASVKKLI